MKRLYLLYLAMLGTPSIRGYVLPERFGIDFDASMQQSARYKVDQINTNSLWKWAREQYTAYIKNIDHHLQDKARIPKITHQIYVQNQLPEKEQAFRQTWIDHHPDWVHFLWTDQSSNFTFGDIVVEADEMWKIIKHPQEFLGSSIVVKINPDKMGIQNKNIYKKTRNPGKCSDILRYEIIYQYGGLYIDTDFECIQPFDVLHHTCDFYAGMNFSIEFEDPVYNCLIGSTPGHIIMQTCVNELSKHEKKKNILAATGPIFFSTCIIQNIKHVSDTTIPFPITYFYPWPNTHRKQKDRKQIEKWICPETFGIHHWHVSWIKNSR